MPIDKSWIDWGTRCLRPYFAKLDEFLDFAYANKDVGYRIYCPCRKCKNRPLFRREVVREHLQEYGFWKKYKMWTKHGETIDQFEEQVQMDEVLPKSDDIGAINIPTPERENVVGKSEGATPGETESMEQFLKLMQGANLPLYPGSKKHTALSFAVRILQAKSLHGWTDNSFKELLEIFAETLPEGVNLPNSYYQAQKLADDSGVTFETVYPSDPLTPNSTPDLIQKMTEQLKEKLTKEVNESLTTKESIEKMTKEVTERATKNISENLSRQFAIYEQWNARITHLENSDRISASSQVQGATSAHQRDSDGD